MKEIISPNTVIAKYISETIDILQPKIKLKKPKEIIFYIGTNINGTPHFATAMVHCVGFMFAKKIRDKFNISTKVVVGIHDNISYESKVDSENITYHKSFFHSFGLEKINDLIKKHYGEYLQKLSDKLNVFYEIEIYSEVQKRKIFRETFLNTFSQKESVGRCISPSTGKLQIRIPCPICHFSDRDAKKTISYFINEELHIKSFCVEHGIYKSVITKNNDTFIDLTTLHRNFVKEISTINEAGTMYVMVKGGDWLYSTATIDLAFSTIGKTLLETPSRIFTPQIVTDSGAKLSKSLISADDKSLKNIPSWLLDLGEFKKEFGHDYLDKITEFTEELFRDPRNMYRTYTVEEIINLLSNQSTGSPDTF